MKGVSVYTCMFYIVACIQQQLQKQW